MSSGKLTRGRLIGGLFPRGILGGCWPKGILPRDITQGILTGGYWAGDINQGDLGLEPLSLTANFEITLT